MRSLSKKLIGFAAKSNILWPMLSRTLIPAANYAQWARRYNGNLDLIPDAVRARIPDLIVLNGPFRGMIYPSIDSSLASLFAKLLGSYEREVHSFVEQICNKNYSEIVNVGCAEGYYAVGLARRLPNAHVIAFDTSKKAVQNCNRLAAANNAGDRVTTGGFCSSATLCDMKFSGRALVISDCEGYEKTLFTAETIARLASHDVLVEAHDFVDVTISSTLRERFAATHDVRSVDSVDDVRKPYLYDYPELKDFTLAEKQLLLAEGRPAQMQWFYFTSKQTQS